MGQRKRVVLHGQQRALSRLAYAGAVAQEDEDRFDPSEFDSAKTSVDQPVTAPHRSLDFLAGREQGWTECDMAYGDAIEADILASGGTAEDAKRIRRWFHLKVQRQG